MARFITRLCGLRRKLVPQVSRRERWLRKLYVPLVRFAASAPAVTEVRSPVPNLVLPGGTMMNVPLWTLALRRFGVSPAGVPNDLTNILA